MRQLLPPARPGRTVDLATIYGYPGGAPHWVRANMVVGLDGSAAADGVSGGLSGPGDKQIFMALRGLADVVLVGAGTVRTEGYRPAAARPEFAEARAAAGQTPAAAIAIVSSRLDLDFTAPLFTEPVTPTIVITTEDAPEDRLAAAREAGEVIVAGRGSVDAAAAVHGLAGHGHRRILCEGGPRLLAAIATAGVLDELCLTVSPRLLAGSGPRILEGPPLGDPARLILQSLLEEESFLFTRYLVARPARPGAPG